MANIAIADGRPIALDDVLAVPDILDSNRYLLLLGALPGSGNSKSLSIKCFSATMPGMGNESFEAHMGGHAMNFRGRRLPPQAITFSFYEDSKFETLKACRSWEEYVVGTQSGNSTGYVDDYGITAGLIIFDTTGARIASHSLFRFYPVDIAEVQSSSESSAPMQIQMQCRYTYMLASSHPSL